MKRKLKILIVLGALTGVGIYLVRKINRRRESQQVADNGYETAHDVLFPGQKVKSNKLRYGPVLPD